MGIEFGGYLPIEMCRNEGNYFSGYPHIMFSCARNAILYILEIRHFQRVFLPTYLCPSVSNALSGYDIVFYHINRQLTPELDNINSIDDKSVIIIPNYFGIKKNHAEYVRKYGNVIFDNTQSFFESIVNGAYNIYSCRKFFGVTDGAYLVSELLQTGEYPELERYQPVKSAFLLNSIVYGTNHAYEDSLLNEEQLGNDGMKGISALSELVLSQVDYDYVIKRRRDNFDFIADGLGRYNELSVERSETSVPMVYPFVYGKNMLRKALVDKHIYIPQWWASVASDMSANDFEKYLSMYLLPLPIDQRYTLDDMKKMLEVVLKML